MTTIRFIACVERGPLEEKSLLLARSIRRFGGRWAGAPIDTFAPRAGRGVSGATRAALEALAVTHHEDVLNTELDDYAIGNKVFAAAHAEAVAREDIVVFLDTDTVILSEPAEFALPEAIDVAVRPVEFHRWCEPAQDDPRWQTRHRRASSAGEGDPADEYWQRMYALCGVEARPFVETSCDRVRIRAYANSGLVVAHREAGVFTQWLRDFRTITAAGHRPYGDVHYLDQLSLGATLARIWARVQWLDGRYNYPLVGRPLLAEPLRSARLDELVHVHYNRYFHVDGFLSTLEPPIERDGAVAPWLQQQLPLRELR